MTLSGIAETRPLRIVREPRVYLVGRQQVDPAAIERFLLDHGLSWQTDTEVGAEALAEMAGRVCYMSYGKGRKTNREFLEHLVQVGHGSVLEHAVWSLLLTGVSRSFTHELIRHRHFSYSQLSQRYVDESDSEFVEPEVIAGDPDLHRAWCEAVNAARTAYDRLVAGLEHHYASEPDRTLRRKLARQAARSVLPNATETRIFVTGMGESPARSDSRCARPHSPQAAVAAKWRSSRLQSMRTPGASARSTASG